MRRCTKCGELKSPSLFAKMAQAKDGTRPSCKACDAAYRRANSERLTAYRQGYYEANRPFLAKLNADWMARNRDEQRAKKAAYQRNNLPAYAARNSDRDARKRQAVPLWADPAKTRDMFLLASLVSEETGRLHHVDHVVPLKSPLVCGLHWHGNMQVLTAPENQSKSNRSWPDAPAEMRV